MNSCQVVFRVKLDAKSKVQNAALGHASQENRCRYTRKTHKKSREGCAACKKRRKKCDERKPSCSRCIDFGLSCEYPQSKVLIDVHTKPSAPALLKWPGIKSPSILIQTSTPDIPHYTNHDLFLLDHFMHNVGVINAGPEYALSITPLVLNIAKTAPFLMHAMLAVAACHLQYTSANGHLYRHPEALHTQFASRGLRQAITCMQAAQDMDSVLTSSMLLNCLSFCYSSWRNGSDSDKPSWQWLRVQLGLKDLIVHTKPFHAESIWLPMFMDVSNTKVIGPPTTGLDIRIAEFIGVTETSTYENCPYLEFWEKLESIVAREPTFECNRLYVDAVGGMDYALIDLLENEDVKALVMFAHWLVLILGITKGWITANMLSECRKICGVLNARLKGDDRVLLEAPAKACGFESGLQTSKSEDA